MSRSAGVKVVYNSFGGRYSDNPRAIYESLRGRGSDFEHVWTMHPDHEHAFPADTPTVRYGSRACIEALEGADLVVSNDHLPLDWHKRPGTTYLQTWHGTPLKRIHHDVRWAPEGRLERLDADVADWDHLISPNRASTPRLREAFRFTGEIHETGYPRNDVLSADAAPRLRAEIRAELGISPQTRAVLYTPTWRDDLVFDADGPGFALQLDLGEVAAKLGRDHVVLLRLHSMVSDRLEIPAGAPVIDVSRYRDVRDLYLAADLMITDYSSTMFDFAVTGKPILFFTYDLAHYRDEVRGFYFDLAEVAPGPLLSTSGEVIDAIRDIDMVSRDHRDRYEEFRRTFCHLETGDAADRVIAAVLPGEFRDRDGRECAADETRRADAYR